jgi:hypothetical protein
MTVTAILGLVTAFFQFFPKVLEFLKLLQKTPAEEHSAIMERIAKERAAAEAGERPTW